MINKRQRALIMALVFFMVGVLPNRPAHALVPLAIGLTANVISAGGSVGSVNLLTAAATALIGGTIFALGLSPTELADGTNPVPVRVPTTTADTSPYIPPPSGVDPDSTYAGTAPAAGTPDSNYSGWSVGAGNYYPTMAAAASGGKYQVFPPLATIKAEATVGQSTAYDCWVEGDYFDGTCNTFVKNSVGEYINGARIYPQYDGEPRCPAGYSVSENSSSGCALTDPSAASKDWLADFQRNGQQYTFSDADSMPGYVNNDGGKVGVYGQDANGNPVYIQVTPTADGGSRVDIYSQAGNNVGVRTVTVGANGTVTNVTTQTVPGVITAPTTINTPATYPLVDTGTGTGTGTIVFPTDYARSGEAASAASSINTKLDVLHKDLTEKGTDLTDPTLPQAVDFQNAFFNGTFAGLLAWRLPAHNSQCPTVVFDYNLFGSHQIHNMDAQCQIAEDVRPIFSVVMIVFWTIAALFVLLGA